MISDSAHCALNPSFEHTVWQNSDIIPKRFKSNVAFITWFCIDSALSQLFAVLKCACKCTPSFTLNNSCQHKDFFLLLWFHAHRCSILLNLEWNPWSPFHVWKSSTQKAHSSYQDFPFLHMGSLNTAVQASDSL